MELKKGIQIIAIVLVLFAVIFVGKVVMPSCEEGVKKTETKLFFHGRIKEKFLDSKERYQPAVILSNGGKYSLENEEIYNNVQIGDILYKDSGTLQMAWIKVNSTKNDTIYFYPQCDGEDVK